MRRPISVPSGSPTCGSSRSAMVWRRSSPRPSGKWRRRWLEGGEAPRIPSRAGHAADLSTAVVSDHDDLEAIKKEPVGNDTGHALETARHLVPIVPRPEAYVDQMIAVVGEHRRAVPAPPIRLPAETGQSARHRRARKRDHFDRQRKTAELR